MKRVVVDTNIFISAAFWKGTPGSVISIFARREAALVLSDDILTELERKPHKERFAADLLASEKTIAEIVQEYRDLADIVQPDEVPESAVRDRKDIIILACAVGGKANYLISGDKDLTTLKTYRSIPILTPADFLHITHPLNQQ
jgi:putative PIN family toxin of toxin-antitoxin system